MQHPNVSWITCDAIAGGLFVCRCDVCGVAMQGPAPAMQADAFARAHAAHESASPTHYGLGDLAARATSAIGIKPCSPCEARRRALNGLMPQVMRRR